MTVEPQPTDWRSIAIVYLAGAVAATALLKVSPAALDLRAGLDLTLTQIAWISSIFTLMTVALGVFVGRWGARFGARNLAGLGLLVMALAGGASMFAMGPVSLLTGRVLEGIGFVLVVVSAPALMTGLASAHHSRLVLGIWSTWLPAGGVMILLSAPSLLGHSGWQGLWLLSTVAALFALALFARLPEVTSAGPPPAVSLGQALASVRPWLLGLAFACFTVQLYAVLLFAPTFLVQEVGFSVAISTLVTSVVLVMAGASGLVGSVILHRGASANLMMATCLLVIGALTPCLIAFADTGLPALALLILYGAFAGCVPSCIYAQAPNAAYVPSATGIVLGLVMAGNGLGILVGPPAVAAVIEATGDWRLASAVPVVACGCGIVCAWMLGRMRVAVPR